MSRYGRFALPHSFKIKPQEIYILYTVTAYNIHNIPVPNR